ncbi:MAG: glycosyltransferase family 39 protein [Candidatus Binatia bacterium]
MRRFLLALTLLAAIAVRLPHLGASRPIGEDEAKTLHRAGLSGRALVADLETSTHPPLYFLLVGAWAGVAGPDIRPVRIVSLGWGIATLGLVVRIAYGWAGVGAALGAAFVLAVSPIHIFYSQEARSYTMAGCLALASTMLLVRWLLHGGWPSWVGYVLASTAAVYTHYWAFFLLPPQGMIVAVAAPPRGRTIAWAAALALVGILFLPWVPTLLAQLDGGGGDWMPPAPAAAVPKTLYRFAAGYVVDRFSPGYRYFAIAPLLVIYLPLLALGGAPVAGESREGRIWRLALVCHLFVPLLVAFVVSVAWRPMYLPGRFDMTLYPAFPLLAGRGMSRLPVPLAVATAVASVISTSAYLALYWLVAPTIIPAPH